MRFFDHKFNRTLAATNTSIVAVAFMYGVLLGREGLMGHSFGSHTENRLIAGAVSAAIMIPIMLTSFLMLRVKANDIEINSFITNEDLLRFPPKP